MDRACAGPLPDEIALESAAPTALEFGGQHLEARGGTPKPDIVDVAALVCVPVTESKTSGSTIEVPRATAKDFELLIKILGRFAPEYI